MKKTLLAIAITGLFTAGAQAATVYDADGTTVDVFGDVEVQLKKDTADESDLVMNIDDSDFGFKVTEVVSDDVSVYAKMAYVDEASWDHATIGFTNDMGSIAFGKQATMFDDSGILNDYVFGIDNAVVNGVNSGDSVIRVDFANGNVYGGIAYLLDGTNGTHDEANVIDAKIGVAMDNLDLSLFLGSTDDGTESETDILAQAVLTLDSVALAAQASTASYDGESSTAFMAQAAFTADKFIYSVALGVTDTEDLTGTESYVQYIAGAEYAVSSNATAYAQIGGNDMDDSELGFATGIKMSF